MAFITTEGKKKLEIELKKLLEIDRPAVIDAIEEARAHGDLSENAEYAAARERQSFIEGRIAELKSKLPSLQVLDPSQIKESKIVFGATVTIQNLETGDISKYQIVGPDEADVSKGTISIMSPIARALIGKTEGDDALVNTPKGEMEYEIKKIEYV